MLETLRTEWQKLQETKIPASELAQHYSEAVTTIRDKIIPDFIVQEYYNLHQIMDEGYLKECDVRDLDFPYKEMAEYEIGVNQYIQSMMEKVKDEEFDSDAWSTDVQTVKSNSSYFVDHLFTDEANPCHRVPVTEAMSFVESLMDIQNQCDVLLEAGITMEQQLQGCKYDYQSDRLADLYYHTEAKFLLEYVDQCLSTYETIKEVLSGKKDPEGVQLL